MVTSPTDGINFNAVLVGAFSREIVVDMSDFPTGKYILRLQGDRLSEAINLLKVAND